MISEERVKALMRLHQNDVELEAKVIIRDRLNREIASLEHKKGRLIVELQATP